jgi:hypothetical protein
VNLLDFVRQVIKRDGIEAGGGGGGGLTANAYFTKENDEYILLETGDKLLLEGNTIFDLIWSRLDALETNPAFCGRLLLETGDALLFENDTDKLILERI